MQTLLFIILPSIISVLFMLRKKTPGSDHPMHVAIVDRIKSNKHRFLTDYVLSLNEKYIYYPQLFHWLLSFLPEKIYKQKHLYISVFIKLLEITAFNLFFYFLYQKHPFDKINFLYANIVINVYPLSYAVWNAKNSGLSPRGIGLVMGQVYTYLIVAYALTGNLLLLLPLFITTFIILLLSLMAMQYVLLSLIFYVS